MKSVKYQLLKFVGINLIRSFEFFISIIQKSTVFFKSDEFYFLKEIESKWELIRDEYININASQDIASIQTFFEEMSIITENENWKSFMIKLYGQNLISNQKKCPVTSDLVNKCPEITAAMFSVLSPGKKILPHRGPYKGILRYHLGLIIPDDFSSCKIIVNGEEKNWEEGKGFVFDDTFTHEAINNSTMSRVILFIDFIRPLPFPVNKINKLIVKLIAQSPFVQETVKKAEMQQLINE